MSSPIIASMLRQGVAGTVASAPSSITSIKYGLTSAAPLVLNGSRCFHSPGSLAAAMGFGSHSSDNDPEILAQEKAKQLKGETPTIIPGFPGWSPALASDSEAMVKAEKAEVSSIDEMQRQTVEVLQKVHHEETREKTGRDLTEMPSIQQNLNQTLHDRSSAGTAPGSTSRGSQ